MTRLGETVEREVKLAAGEEFVLADALDGEALEGRTFVSTYHDTADYRLAASGLTLRHRVENGKGLWQLLGEHQDAVVAEERLRALAAAPSVPAALVAGLLVERQRARRRRARDTWHDAWAQLRKQGAKAA